MTALTADAVLGRLFSRCKPDAAPPVAQPSITSAMTRVSVNCSKLTILPSFNFHTWATRQRNSFWVLRFLPKYQPVMSTVSPHSANSSGWQAKGSQARPMGSKTCSSTSLGPM